MRSFSLPLVLLSLAACSVSAVAADLTVFKCVDAQGRVEFSDVARKGCKALDLPKPKPLTIARAKWSIEERLNDPESARYKSTFLVRRTGAVCGFVNSKNRMGGYDGFKGFVVSDGDAGDEVWIEGEPGFHEATRRFCSEKALPALP
jgi:hypothetical protein